MSKKNPVSLKNPKSTLKITSLNCAGRVDLFSFNNAYYRSVSNISFVSDDEGEGRVMDVIFNLNILSFRSVSNISCVAVDEAFKENHLLIFY